MRFGTMITGAVSLFALLACEDARPTFVISHVIYMDKDCLASADSDKKWTIGRYDPYCSDHYSIPLRVESYMMPRSDDMRGRSEPNIVQFEGVEISILDPGGALWAPPFSAAVEGTLGTAAGGEPGVALVRVPAVPSALSEIMLDFEDYETREFVISITLFGKTTGGLEVESDEFLFPIEVCKKCQTRFSDEQGICDFSEDAKAFFDELQGCQDRSGVNGAICTCDREGGADRCAHCFF